MTTTDSPPKRKWRLPKGKTPQSRGKKEGELTFAEEKSCSVGIRVLVGHLMQEFGQLRGATEELGKKRG